MLRVLPACVCERRGGACEHALQGNRRQGRRQRREHEGAQRRGGQECAAPGLEATAIERDPHVARDRLLHRDLVHEHGRARAPRCIGQLGGARRPLAVDGGEKTMVGAVHRGGRHGVEPGELACEDVQRDGVAVDQRRGRGRREPFGDGATIALQILAGAQLAEREGRGGGQRDRDRGERRARSGGPGAQRGACEEPPRASAQRGLRHPSGSTWPAGGTGGL